MQSTLLIVPDTNVYISGATIATQKPLTPPQHIRKLWHEDQIEIAVSPTIVEELFKVLNYDKVRAFTGMSEQRIDDFVKEVVGAGVMVSGTTTVSEPQTDVTDQKFIACAIEAQADFIVSGDRHLLDLKAYEGIPIVSPSDFIASYLDKAA